MLVLAHRLYFLWFVREKKNSKYDAVFPKDGVSEKTCLNYNV